MSDNENQNQEEILHAKHRKERKELQAKIQSLKKTATKDKKKKILEEIAKLELDMDKKHAEELESFNQSTCEASKGDLNEIVSIEKSLATQRISKAEKRRQKKAHEEKERQANILAEEELNKNGPRDTENSGLKAILKEKDLKLFEVPSDGDCLYNAIRHQLEITGRPLINVKRLRELTAEYIGDNKESLIHYMTNLETNECLSDEEFIKYCDAIKNTPAWGGQIEIQALSSMLKVPIVVLQATGPPTIQGEDEYEKPNLTITYHRHMYSLGEHYNSTRPLTSDDTDDENE